MGILASGQPALLMTSPSAGAIVSPGQTLTVTVAASGGTFSSVSVIGPGIPIGANVLTSPPYRYSFTIPSTMTPGPVTIAAIGSTASGPVFSDVLLVDIERADSPAKLVTDLSELELQAGDVLAIRVYGKYADGSVVDLSKSTQVTYASESPAIATVTGSGAITAVSAGSTKVVIRARGRGATVKITVGRVPK